jgi:hypothetical protein
MALDEAPDEDDPEPEEDEEGVLLDAIFESVIIL